MFPLPQKEKKNTLGFISWLKPSCAFSDSHIPILQTMKTRTCHAEASLCELVYHLAAH